MPLPLSCMCVAACSLAHTLTLAAVSTLAPSTSMWILEEAWNAYPHCKTVLVNGYLSIDKFRIDVETIHVADDAGNLENVVGLSAAELKERKVELLNIADAYSGPKSEHPEYNALTYKSAKTGAWACCSAGWCCVMAAVHDAASQDDAGMLLHPCAQRHRMAAATMPCLQIGRFQLPHRASLTTPPSPSLLCLVVFPPQAAGRCWARTGWPPRAPSCARTRWSAQTSATSACRCVCAL